MRLANSQAQYARQGDLIWSSSLKPRNRADNYGLLPFTDVEWARVQAVFPDGVCDFTKPGVDQQGTIPWETYQDDAAGGAVIYGGRPLGDPPVSQ